MCDEIVKCLFSPHFNNHHLIFSPVNRDQIFVGKEEIPTNITSFSFHFSVDIEQGIDLKEKLQRNNKSEFVSGSSACLTRISSININGDNSSEPTAFASICGTVSRFVLIPP